MAITYLSGERIQGNSVGEVTGSLTAVIDGSDTVLTFTETGTFTPAGTFDVEYLVVGGGGSGGFWLGGGGGAGAYRVSTSNAKNHEVTAQTYTITVGAGGDGSGNTDAGTNGEAGDSSIFDTITSVGGGGGASHTSGAGTNSVGSGGGSADYTLTAGTGGTYGNNGGIGTNQTDVNDTGGGGGGSGGTGGNGTTQQVGGAGGIGTANDISGSSLYYAAGGGGGAGTSTSTGGGTGGSSIGGDGGGPTDDEAGGNGTVNRGSGGGGGAHNAGLGGNGSTGVVIIRFVTSGNSYSAGLGIQDDKTTISNVPVGTRFEEIDTRKIFRIKAGVAVGLGSAANATNSGATRVSDSAGTNLGTYSWEYDTGDYTTTGVTQNLGTKFSVSFWVKYTTVAAWKTVMGKGATDNSEEFVFYLDGSSYFSGQFIPNRSPATTTVPNGTSWYHLVYTCDGDANSYKCYVNGVLGGTNTDGTQANTYGTTAFVLGTTRGGVSSGDWFRGKLSQTLLYNDVLTADEVTALYNGGDGVATPNGNGLLAWYDFQDASSGALTNKQSTSAVPDSYWVEKGTA